MTKEDINFDLKKNDDWFVIKLKIDRKKGCDIKKCIQGETYLNAMKLVFKKLKVFSTHFVHFGRRIGPIYMELKQMEPQYIKNVGNWKPDTQDECYSDKMHINIMKVMSGASRNYKVHYNPRTLPKPLKKFKYSFFHSFINAKFHLMI